jgi:hypothetical protein
MLLPLAVMAILLGVARLSVDESWASAAAVGIAVAGPMTVLLGMRSPSFICLACGRSRSVTAGDGQ